MCKMSLKKMRIFAALAMPFVLIACAITEGGGDFMPPAMALQITAINNMTTPVTVKIRHVYRGGVWSNDSRSYSDWITVQAAPGASQPLGGETVEYHYKGNNGTMSGFILLDRKIKNKFDYGDNSSFELEIATAADIICLSGYETADPRFDQTGLGDLQPHLDVEAAEKPFVGRKILLFSP